MRDGATTTVAADAMTAAEAQGATAAPAHARPRMTAADADVLGCAPEFKF
jgi:hypothetical protein